MTGRPNRMVLVGDPPRVTAVTTEIDLDQLLDDTSQIAHLDLGPCARARSKVRAQLDRHRDLDAALAARIALLSIAPPEDRLLPVQEAATVLGVEPGWLRRQKDFPARVTVSSGQVRYSMRVLQQWIARRLGT